MFFYFDFPLGLSPSFATLDELITSNSSFGSYRDFLKHLHFLNAVWVGFCIALPPLVYHGMPLSTEVKLAVCVISITWASAVYVRYELMVSRRFMGDSAAENLWNSLALVGLRIELPFDCLFITVCYEIHSGLCMAGAAGMGMSLVVGIRKVAGSNRTRFHDGV